MRPLPSVRPAPTGWRRINGPMELARRLGRWPDLVPHHFAVRMTADLSVLGTVTDANARVEMDGDFYAMAASVGIIDPGFDGVEGFIGLTHLSPMMLAAHTDIWEEQGGRRLSNLPVSIGSVWGRGDRPFVYPCPWILPAGARVNVRLRHVGNGLAGGSAGTVLIFVWHGFKRLSSTPPLPADILLEPRLIDVLRGYADRGQLYRIEPYFYSLLTGQSGLGVQSDFIPGLTESPTVTIADADFAATYIMSEFFDDVGQGYISDSLNHSAAHLIRFVVDEGRRRMDDRPLSIDSVTGHGKRWTKLPYPLLLRRGQTFSAIVTPQVRSGISVNRWLGHITLAGARIHRGGR